LSVDCIVKKRDVSEPKITEKLQKFINSSNDEYGFILISGGFSRYWDTAPKELVENLVEAIREQPDKNFVWQYNQKGTGTPLHNLPKNLYVDKWLPQQNLLAHPKCRAHVSHGGLNSVIESVWHGVPVIGWPLTTAGYDNLLRVTARLGGLMLDTKRPTKQQLISVFTRIYIRFYHEEMSFFQDLVTDVPYTELNHSAFWVEFIVRHQEVPHARSGADELNIFQYFLVDVTLFIFVVVGIALYTMYFILRLAVRTIKYVVCLPFSSKKIKSPPTTQVGKKSAQPQQQQKKVAYQAKKKD